MNQLSIQSNFFSDNLEINNAIHQLLESIKIDINHCHINKIRQTDFSNCWEIKNNNNLYYLKHNPQHFTHEGKLLNFFNQFSFNVPKVISFHPKINLFLSASCGKKTLRENFKIEHFTQALLEYAKIQNTLGLKKDRLEKVGLSTVSSQEIINSILWAEQYQHYFSLSFDFSGFNYQQIKEELDILLQYKNLSIGHQDFHDGNIVVNENKAFIIDWSETALCNPLFSAMQAINKISVIYQLSIQEKDKLINNYLEVLPFFIFPNKKNEYLKLVDKYLKYYYLFTLKKIIDITPQENWNKYQNHLQFIFK
jgi:hypothetical protein